jgi:hypothetical protein
MDNNPSLIVKPLSKLKDAFKSQAIDGQFLDLSEMSSKTGSEGDLSDGADMEMQYSDILANYTRLKNKDMSTWKVSIEDVVEKKVNIMWHDHHFQPFTIHYSLQSSSIPVYLEQTAIHLTPRILLNPSTHRPPCLPGLPCFLSHPR